MQFDIDTKGFDIDSKAVLKATVKTLNTTATTVRKEISSDVREVYNIKKRDLDPYMRITKVTGTGDTAYIRVTSRPISLMRFNATASKAFDRGSKRYFKTSARILKKNRKAVVKDAFIGRAKNGKDMVFRRLTNKRLPVARILIMMEF